MTAQTAGTNGPFESGATSLAGKIALITGASSGLGAHFSRLLASQGAHVICAARRMDRLAGLVAEIQGTGGKASAVAMDVEDEASVIAGFASAIADVGLPSIVIANAGMNLTGLSIDVPVSDFDKIMAVNVRGAFLTAREGARHMMAAGSAQSGDGRIILIASIGGLRPLPGLVGYSTSKAAVIMLAKGLASEWARKGINVNAICPGYIETELNEGWLNEPGGQKMVAGFPRRRIMPEHALDGAVTWLVSDAARFTTGSIIQVDDGQAI